jgi:hypothetical protein
MYSNDIFIGMDYNINDLSGDAKCCMLDNMYHDIAMNLLLLPKETSSLSFRSFQSRSL